MNSKFSWLNTMLAWKSLCKGISWHSEIFPRSWKLLCQRMWTETFCQIVFQNWTHFEVHLQTVSVWLIEMLQHWILNHFKRSNCLQLQFFFCLASVFNASATEVFFLISYPFKITFYVNCSDSLPYVPFNSCDFSHWFSS